MTYRFFRADQQAAPGRPSKLPTRLPKLPGGSGERVMRVLKRAGFPRQKGRLDSFEKHVGEQVFKTVVPVHSELAHGTLADIRKQRGLQLEECLPSL